MASIIAALLAGCGTDDPTPELVVTDASMGSGTPTLIGASAGSVYWSLSASGGKRIAGGSLVSLPTDGHEVLMATGAVAHAGDHVVGVSGSTILRAGVDTAPSRVMSGTADVLAETPEAVPRLVWTVGDKIYWGANEAEGSAVMPRTIRADHVRASKRWCYAAVDASGERRMIRVDRTTAAIGFGPGSERYAESFPGGAKTGATYRGRIVGADDAGAFWLVEEIASGATTPARAVLVNLPENAPAATVVLENINAPVAFFVADDAFYWQEGDALLTASRDGGAASIAAHLDGTAGALADGFVYYVTSSGSIERLAL
jgi:hypothetical protein